jgi:hypothetical protein
VGGGQAAGRPSTGRSAPVKLPFAKKESLVKRVLKSNYLTGMTVRYGGLALLAILAVFEIPAVVRYINIERM